MVLVARSMPVSKILQLIDYSMVFICGGVPGGRISGNCLARSVRKPEQAGIYWSKHQYTNRPLNDTRFNNIGYLVRPYMQGLSFAKSSDSAHNALQMQRTGAMMKTATFPSLRVDPELREAAEQNLQEGETISAFVEQSIRESRDRRRHQREFIARGLASRDDAQRTGKYVSADAVLGRLEQMLATAKAGK
jgi:predicted transcriptional regulator